MLLNLWPYSKMPLQPLVRARLECLESRLRRCSTGAATVRSYSAWLNEDGLDAVTRVTLHEDFERYKALCDDVQYGGGRKALSLDPRAGDDARRWLMGFAWGDHPLLPNLSSSTIRCLLMAQSCGAEVRFTYLAAAATSYRPWTGIPHGVLAGQDSAYLRLRLAGGRIGHFDFARIHGDVRWTGADTAAYLPVADDPQCDMLVSVDHAGLAHRLANQMQGFRPRDDGSLILHIPTSMLVMAADVTESWFRRHAELDEGTQRSGPRHVNVGSNTTLKIEVRDV